MVSLNINKENVTVRKKARIKQFCFMVIKYDNMSKAMFALKQLVFIYNCIINVDIYIFYQTGVLSHFHSVFSCTSSHIYRYNILPQQINSKLIQYMHVHKFHSAIQYEPQLSIKCII